MSNKLNINAYYCKFDTHCSFNVIAMVKTGETQEHSEPSEHRQNTTLARRLAAIMFTDIVSYSSIMSQNEEKALGVMRNNRLIQKSMAEPGGIYISESVYNANKAHSINIV